MIAAFRAELAKQLRRPRTYVAFAVAALIPVIIAVAVKANPPGPGRAPLLFLSLQSGLVQPFVALRVMSPFLLVILVALFAGDAIAGEASSGNLRYVLVRPISRGRLLASKLAVAATLALAVTIVIVIVGSMAGGLTYGWHSVDLAFPREGLVVHHSVAGLLGDLTISTVYVAWTMSIVVAFALMLSTMTDSPLGSIAGGVGLFVVSQILDSIDSLGSIRDGLPTAYLGSWDNLVFHNDFSETMVKGLLIPIPYVAAFVALAWWWFGRKDVLS